MYDVSVFNINENVNPDEIDFEQNLAMFNRNFPPQNKRGGKKN